ncbi:MULTISPECIES: NAD(P)H-binding protein [Priestia]|jgi:nucleoside-diphosphate-sugar epimerase|uniref:NAD(P)H-binding protein n=1 Tax=Priestia TaxID=2800373 RepID=UPI000BFA0F3B|nr:MULTISPECIES: NAD(P)H-binding protein [Priestia]PFO19138.1 NAD-dependent dehydratase [Priestia megaterium]PFV94006.1 NAD-dependent dehydratase [Priestia megaterium]PGX75699.1 NAD-dependent dehydratase [Priestia megaterium]QTL52427.1 NAD(P)H-binding protein [Priestia aryabhattai]
MKVLVVGANGRVGSHLVNKLVENEHFVYAGTRKDNLTSTSNNARYVHIDLLASPDVIAENMHDAEAIFFVAGSRGKDLLQVDLNGAVNVMRAAESKNIKRFIMLSSVFSLEPDKWDQAFLKDLTNYNIAKHFADHWLIHNTKLDYTIVQPGVLKEQPGSGKINVNIDYPGENAIENVVDTLVQSLRDPNTIGKVITMSDGKTPIADALRNL